MKKTIGIITLAILSVVSLGTVMSSSTWDVDEDEERYEEEHESDDDHEHSLFHGAWFESRADVRPVEDALYQSECGGCHFAYQPGLLPGQDWDRIMSALDEHYGDDASLDERQVADIRRYLLNNAADRADLSRARAFAAGSAAATELPRITQARYFRREHAEIPQRLVGGNDQVGSFSNCQACHRNADAGVYNEHQVLIPGLGRWDD